MKSANKRVKFAHSVRLDLGNAAHPSTIYPYRYNLFS